MRLDEITSKVNITYHILAFRDPQNPLLTALDVQSIPLFDGRALNGLAIPTYGAKAQQFRKIYGSTAPSQLAQTWTNYLTALQTAVTNTNQTQPDLPKPTKHPPRTSFIERAQPPEHEYA